MNRGTRMDVNDFTGVEPMLLDRKINRRLSVQNSQLNSNWLKVRQSLDKIKGFEETKMEREKSEMLKYQEKLKGNSGNFDISEIFTLNTVRRSRAMSSNEASGDGVKVTWPEKTVKPRQRRLSISSDTLMQSSTMSSEKKRIFRRRASFSLLDLKKLNSEFSNLTSDLSRTSLDSLEEEPVSDRRKSVFDITDEENDEPIRLPPPVRLPPIHQLQPAKLATRNFESDTNFERRKGGELNETEDLKYCRYLRNCRRKSIA
ncbi:unnamed protein product [Porites evermanni]|uniref:Uncharacterized protein n=1 Tax=Porites evermanni TaxID=104178 RepID=A0ABN8T1A4_9CNID|nr:unnamed protein product [Porites evermanni]